MVGKVPPRVTVVVKAVEKELKEEKEAKEKVDPPNIHTLNPEENTRRTKMGAVAAVVTTTTMLAAMGKGLVVVLKSKAAVAQQQPCIAKPATRSFRHGRRSRRT